MSIHPTLRGAAKGKQQRSVLKLIEKIKHLQKKELWQEGMSVFGLPKIKIIKVKLKKEKAAEKPEEAAEAAAGEAQAAPAAESDKAPAKPSTKAQTKPSSAKPSTDKK